MSAASTKRTITVVEPEDEVSRSTIALCAVYAMDVACFSCYDVCYEDDASLSVWTARGFIVQ